MTYRVTFRPSARRAIDRDLPEGAAAACLEFIFGDLAERPRRVGKPLRNEFDGQYSARRGEFRIIYEIDEGRVVVMVVTIRHRRDAYHR